MLNFNEIKNLYDCITRLPKLNNEYCILFVYNSPKTMSDSFHTTECILDEELLMIMNSFRTIAEKVYSIDGEALFLKDIDKYKQVYKYILVYSMAQNVKGNGRRSMIPILCDYYGLINIGADFISTALGRSKELMYLLLKPKGFPFPETYYIYNRSDINNFLQQKKEHRWLFKPNNESSSIGLEVHNLSDYSTKDIYNKLIEYHKDHPIFCIQEFIEGDEVAVPILKIKDSYFSPGISQVEFPPGIDYISYDMISLETYGYYEYNGCISKQLYDISVDVVKTLKFTSMSRIDFRIHNNTPYIEDIGANPTISENNGVNQLFCEHLQAEPSCVYVLLVYTALIEQGLFEPSFH